MVAADDGMTMPTTPKRVLTFAIGLGVSCVTVGFAGVLAAALQGWFGISDLGFLVLWFLPLGVTAAGISACIVGFVGAWPPALRYLVGLGVGVFLGFLWTLGVVLLLGPWWGAVSLPALACWSAGAVSAVAGGLLLVPNASPTMRRVTIAALMATAVVGVGLSGSLATQLTHDQTLRVRFLKWTPSEEPLAIEMEIEGAEPLSEAAVSLVRRLKPTGRVLVMWSGSTHGQGPSATALILLEKPLSGPVSLRQPDRSLALYVQESDGFVVHPPDLKTLEREITLSPRDEGVWCSVEIANGGVQSGPARIW